jgi:peptide/nickel transport system permease protein
MLAFIFRRIAEAMGVIAAMVVIVFFGVNVVGDPTWLLVSPEMSQIQIEETRAALGLDRPIWEQFFVFVSNAAQGDLGRSFVHGEPAIRLILSRMPATLELAFVALLLAVVIGIPLGLYAGLKPESKGARAIMAVSILGFMLGWLPATGRGDTASLLGWQTSLLTADGWSHIFLPALNLALLKISLVIRLARAGAREAALMDYVKFARAKGLSQRRIVGVHILKNIMIPIVTVLGLEFGSLIAFSVVTETIFAWPGMGKLLLEAIQRLDRPVIVAYVMVVVCLFVVINLLVDLAYAALDPRVRLSEAKA